MSTETTPATPKKVLVAVTTIAVGGGAEKIATTVANQLLHKGVDVTVLTQYDHTEEHAVAGKRINLGYGLAVLRTMPRWRRHLNKIARAYNRTIGTARVCRREHIDTVVSFLEESNFYVLLAKRLFRLRVRTVVSVRMDPLRYGRFYKFLIARLYRHADVVVAVTRGVEETLRTDFGLTNVITIYNPIVVADVLKKAAEPLPPEYSFLQDTPYTVTVGRLTYQKGQWHLLRAFRRLKSLQADAQLVVVGDGDFRSDLQAMAHRLQIADSVHFVGQQTNIYPFLQHADRFVFTSLWEGLPNALLEALAVGLPALATDSTSGMREMLAPELSLDEPVTYPYRGQAGTLLAPFPDEASDTRFCDTEAEQLYADYAAAWAADPYHGTPEIATRFEMAAIIEQWHNIL